MFDAWELRADDGARKRASAAFLAAAATLAVMVAGVAVVSTRPTSTAHSSKVDVSFRPPPPPPPPAKIEVQPPRPPPPKPPPVAKVEAPPAPAPMVAPTVVPSKPAPEAVTPVAAIAIAPGGTGDGRAAAAPPADPDESQAPVAAAAGHAGPVNLPEDADPPEPDEANVQPEYPESARTTGKEAKVVLKIVIERDGHVARVQVLKGEEPFVAAALSAVQGWKYVPARLEGQPIAVFKIVNLTFQLRE